MAGRGLQILGWATFGLATALTIWWLSGGFFRFAENILFTLPLVAVLGYFGIVLIDRGRRLAEEEAIHKIGKVGAPDPWQTDPALDGPDAEDLPRR